MVAFLGIFVKEYN